jgi:hypothetical protein
VNRFSSYQLRTTERPHVHAQWLFFFPTDDLDDSLRLVRAAGV